MSASAPPEPSTPDDPTTELPPVPEDLVATPAVDADLGTELRRVARPFGKPTLVLAAVLVLAVAFGAGAWTHAAFGSSSGTGSASDAGRSAPGSGQQGGGQAGGFRGAGGRGTAGTVEKVDGSTVTLKTVQGEEVKVSASDSTTVGLTQPGKLADLKPGATVTVQGRTGTDGSVTAQSIVQQPAR
ncbi:hypothetical protein ATK36_2839 [Amycolatopsis sulphurea]|uniref:Uncharacterized protein n=1 Tax=Amycolatopsis sulphurea TaxID=76022 RepID=A0A2A9FBI8_9PSEU|nr:DUF5666 domain-containing protein [Amycolatopsis sulphurea]PFG47785.1 hypothetical protein ATK36_2839 [Amycolatopsis sulphurea]